MATQIDLNTALQIVQGAGFLASGGGGSVQIGKQLVGEVFADGVTGTLVDLAELSASQWVAVAAELGSPEKLFGTKLRNRSAANAFETVQTAARALAAAGDPYFAGFSRFDAVSSVEIGALSTILGLQVAIDLGLVATDTDGAGRAVPTLPLLTFARATPVVPNALTSDSAPDGSFVSAQLSVSGEPQLETAAIGMIGTGLLGAVAGIATWPATVATLSQPGKMPVLGSTANCARLGKIIASNSGSQRIAAALGYVGGVMGRPARGVYVGKVTAMDQTTQGLDIGHVTISGTGIYGGTSLRIIIQNENILAQRDDQTSPLVMSPDSLCYMPLTGDTLDNSDLYALVSAPGYQPIDVAMIAIGAAAPVLQRPDLMTAWADERAAFGYFGPYFRPWIDLDEHEWQEGIVG